MLTGREMLTLFARIRGLRSSENRITTELEKLASFVDLTQYLDRPCGQYSGGNKRKLNVALALIGRYCKIPEQSTFLKNGLNIVKVIEEHILTFCQAKGDAVGRAYHRGGPCGQEEDVGDHQRHQKVDFQLTLSYKKFSLIFSEFFVLASESYVFSGQAPQSS